MDMPGHASRLLREFGRDAAWFVAELDDLVAAADAPEHVRNDCLRFVEEAGNPATALRALREDPHALELLVALARVSRFAVQTLQLMPQLFWSLIQDEDHRKIWGREELGRQLRVRLDGLRTAEHRLHELIRFNHYHHVRIMLGDVTGHLPFEALTREIADLAEATIEAALEMAVAKVSERYGRTDCPFVILGFGKLGGRELNYSSDIDLVFVYAGDGETSGAAKLVAHHEYFRRVGSEVIRILSQRHAQGQLYRVDMRLRPHGASGELVHALGECVDYYYTVGRPWERQALIKARPVAGDRALGERLLGELRPWIYPKANGIADFEDTRVMRQRIEERADVANLKTGAGGIRDIEFLVQFYQLGFAGAEPELRQPGTLPGLRQLGRLGLLSAADELALSRDYCWLRMVEHRLQMFEFRQLHHIPAEVDERRALARRCGYGGAEPLTAFDAELDEVRSRVRNLATRYYLHDQRQADGFLAALASIEVSDELITQVMAPYAFPDPKRAWATLGAMAREPFFILSRNRTERNLSLLLPILLPLLVRTPDPQSALSNFGRIVDAVGGRADFFALLRRRPHLLAVLCDLAGWSNFVVGELTRVTGLPDELAEVLDEDLQAPSADVLSEGTEVLRGLHDPVPPLVFMHARELCLIAIRDLRGASLGEVSFALSRLAIAILRLVVDRAIAECSERWGRPRRADGSTGRFAVLGLGKLGSHELTYASDMDVVFVGDDDVRTEGGDHEADWFWSRVARRIVGICKEGGLYPVDARLRPWGDQGPLVTSIAGLQGYWGVERALWERMAMTRVAPLAGDHGLGLEAAMLIRNAAIGRPLPDDAVAQVRDMRRRLEESVAGRDHLKRGWGGYVDIEFLVHYLCLGRDPAELPAGASIAGALAALGRLAVLPATAVTECDAALGVLRRMEARMRLMEGRAISSIPIDPEARQRFARCADYVDREAMDLELHIARERARRWFDAVLGA